MSSHRLFAGVSSSLQVSDDRCTPLIHSLPFGVLIADPDGTIHDLNPAAVTVLGEPALSIVGRNVFSFTDPNDFQRLSQSLQDVVSGTTRIVKTSYRTSDDTQYTPVRVHIAPTSQAGPSERVVVTLLNDGRTERAGHVRRLQAALEATEDAVYLVDSESMTFLDVNSAALRMLGYSREQLLTMGPMDIDVQVPAGEIRRLILAMKTDSSRKPFRTTHRRADGSVVPVEMQVSLYRWTDMDIVIGIARDITTRISTEKELQRVNRELDTLLRERTTTLTDVSQQLQLMNTVVETSLNGVTVTDADGVVQQINASFSRITGYQPREAVGQKTSILKSGRHDESFYAEMWQRLLTVGEWHGEIWNRRKTGEIYPEWLEIRAIYSESGEISNYVAIFHDLTELRAKEAEAAFHANFDGLTKLPNRASFLERIASSIRTSRKQVRTTAVVIADIDDFRKVNESMGHTFGDSFLEVFALLLKQTVGSGITVARIGGDEFGLLVEEVADEWEYAHITEKISSLCGTPISVDGTSVQITVSMGVALYPEDGNDAETLLNSAEIAMYQAKSRPQLPDRGRVGMFTAALDAALRRKISLEAQMRQDLVRGRFMPFYQPRIDLASGEILGAEALARWIRDDGTIVSPDEFIPLAEETNMIVPLGEALLSKIRHDLSAVFGSNMPGMTISFNASMREIHDPAFLDRLTAIVGDCCPSGSLEIELTESVVMDDVEKTLPIIKGIKDRGLSLAIDDFGTGYSSLNYLKRLPVDVLKIDRSFVKDLGTDTSDQAIITTIIAMGRALQLKTVAEGIETEGQRHFLVKKGCLEGQGYLFGVPMGRDDFLKLLGSPRNQHEKFIT